MKWNIVYVSKTLGDNIRLARAGSLLKWLVRTFKEPRHEYVVLHATKGGKLSDDEMINLVTSFIKIADSKHKDYFKDSDVETWKTYLHEALGKLEGIGDTGYLVARYKSLENSEFLRKFYFIKTEFTKDGEEVSTEIPKFSKDRTLNITSYVYSPYEKFDIEYNVKLKRDMSIAIDSKTGKETRNFFDDLSVVKEQLFDAPVEVKESFNNMINYFSSPEFLRRMIGNYENDIRSIEKELNNITKTIYGKEGPTRNPKIKKLEELLKIKKQALEGLKKELREKSIS